MRYYGGGSLNLNRRYTLTIPLNPGLAPTLDPKRFSAAAATGLRVFPVMAGLKTPAVKWKEFSKCAATPEQLQEWDDSQFNVGVICGEGSGCVVLDVDSAEAQAAVDELDLPPTPWVKTGRGAHFYFSRPAGGIRNTAMIDGLKLDFRGDGGYVVGHGSIHESGQRYQWVISPDDIPFAELPVKLLELIAKPRSRASSPRATRTCELDHGGKFASYLATALSEAVRQINAAEEGRRNDQLFHAGVQVARDVAGAGSEWAPFAEAIRKVAIKIGLTPAETEATLASCWTTGSAEPTPWIVTARQWIYLSKPDIFYHVQSGQYLSVKAFNNTFISQRITGSTFASFLLARPYVEIFYDLDYLPGKNETYTERGGLSWFNTYRPSDVLAVEGDAYRFVEFISYLVPEPSERDHLLQMIAWTVRNPGQKLRHALLLRSSAQGIGKSMLVEIWGRLLGKSNVRKTTTEELSGPYQGFIKETLLVVLEELNWGFGPSGYNRLKDLITGSEASVNEKFIPVRMWPNVATFVILTNLETPMIVEDRDRRLFYIDNHAQKREPEYYRAFADWWGQGLGIIRGFLDTVDLTGFDPFAAPPMTAAKIALIADSRTELVKDLAAALEDRSGTFNRDVVTMREIEAELATTMRGKTKAQLIKALGSLGAASFGQQRISSGGAGNWPSERISLWAIRNTGFWDAAGNQARGEEYRRQEGLLAELAGWPFEVHHSSEWPSDTESWPELRDAGG